VIGGGRRSSRILVIAEVGPELAAGCEEALRLHLAEGRVMVIVTTALPGYLRAPGFRATTTWKVRSTLSSQKRRS
jgi:hypothetical protein